MCTQAFCDDFKQANPCATGRWTDHNFGPAADQPVPGHEDALVYRVNYFCRMRQ